MKNQPFIPIIIICLIMIGGVFVFSACTSFASAQSNSVLQAQVNTAAAATLTQYMIETRVAEQSIALLAEPVNQAQATEPPVFSPTPTPTLVPTESAQPTDAAPVESAPPTPTAQPTVAAPVEAAPPTPTAPPIPVSSPKIIADQNTNCRLGPSTRYSIETAFLKGSESSVEGRDRGKNWWYIVNPNDASGFCWVWEGSTTVQGDTSTLQVIESPTSTYPKSSGSNYNYNGYDPFGWCGNAGFGYKFCGNYPVNYCGKRVNWNRVVFCDPNPRICNPNKWWTCNPNVRCNCKPVFQNPCKRWNCPPPTVINFKNYCGNYPQCCD